MSEPIPYLALVVLAFLAAVIVIYFIRLKHLENKELIEKGFYSENSKSVDYLKKISFQRGVFLVSVGIGLILAIILNNFFPILSNFAGFVGIMFISGGIGLIIFRKIEK